MGVKLPEDVIQQVEELEENIIKEEILPALSDDIAPRLEHFKTEDSKKMAAVHCSLCIIL